LADEDSGEDRTEEASEQRREQFREDGQVGQSRDLVAALALLAATGALYASAQWSFRGLWSLFEAFFGEGMDHATRDWTIESLGKMLGFVMRVFFYVMAPVSIATMLVGIVSNIAQTGFLWTTKPLEPNLEKLNPMNAIGRIFGVDGIVDLVKAILKFIVVGAVLYPTLMSLFRDSGTLWSLESGQIASSLGHHIIRLLFSVGLALLVLSALDFGFQKFRYEQKLKMTKQEAREDRKQSEGNPQIKGRIRSMQRARASRKMVDAIKKADVVVTNPTHIAVALVYDRENMLAPRVVAKGADFMAERIKKIARENGVPCVENVPLARALFKAIKIGQLIPRDLYNAVAEVLAYVYRLKGKML